MPMEAERKPGPSEGPRAVMRILKILETIGQARGPETLAHIAREIEAPRSSVLNLLRELAQHGYVAASGGRYGLGPNSFRLATTIAGQRNFLSSAEHIIKDLSALTGETVMVAILGENKEEMIYVAKEESRSALRVSATVGDTRPLYATAGGLAMLAHMPRDQVLHCLEPARLKPLTPLTEIEPRAIEAKLDHVRAFGWIQLTGSVNLGASTVAAPVFSGDGVIASVIVGISTERYKASPQQALCSATVKAAQDLSKIMGG